MKYLFFDIECSNCFNKIGKMCEFGYVIADEDFKILKQDDIPMSPGYGRDNRFHLKGRKGGRDLELAYDYDFYYSQKQFPYHYQKIRELMEGEDVICFAYSMSNDINHLYNSCRRYKKKPLSFTCFDVQKIAGQYLGRPGISLKKAALSLVDVKEFLKLQQHLSRDDAKLALLLLKSICVKSGKNLRQLLEESDFAKANSVAFIKEEEDKAGHKEAERLCRERIEKDREEAKAPENAEKVCAFSGGLKSNLATTKGALRVLDDKGWLLCRCVATSRYFIVLNENDREKMNGLFVWPYNGTILTFDELLNSNRRAESDLAS